MNWEGFLMGISDFGLERLKEERQKKMQKELLELKEKHQIAAEKRQERVLARTVKRTEETADGKLQDYGTFGDPIGEAREQSPWVTEQRDMTRTQHEDALETSASQRNYQSRSLDLRGQELAERRAYRERDMNSGGGAELPELDGPAAIEQIFAPILSTAKNPAEEALLWQVVNETYESAMAPGASAPPSAARMRDMARRTIAERMGSGQFGQTWRYDQTEASGGRATY